MCNLRSAAVILRQHYKRMCVKYQSASKYVTYQDVHFHPCFHFSNKNNSIENAVD